MADKSTTSKSRLEVIETAGEKDEGCKTFVFHEEDHTLGNSLRYIVMKNPDVDFCGYSIPHPSENKINFRIQTNGPPANDVLRKGLTDLHTVCDHVLKTFELYVVASQIKAWHYGESATFDISEASVNDYKKKSYAMDVDS